MFKNEMEEECFCVSSKSWNPEERSTKKSNGGLKWAILIFAYRKIKLNVLLKKKEKSIGNRSKPKEIIKKTA